jgi:hypothetical protein
MRGLRYRADGLLGGARIPGARPHRDVEAGGPCHGIHLLFPPLPLLGQETR